MTKESAKEPAADSLPTQPPVVAVGDEHQTHAWTMWRAVGGLFYAPAEQQRHCVICGFVQRALIRVVVPVGAS